MALHLLSSNRVETLQQQLAQLLTDEPLRDPFAAEQIIVPGMAMARWLNLQLAQSHGVAANIDYQLAASWIWQLAIAVLPDVPPEDPLARDSAAWKIFQLLPSLLPRAEFLSLRRYLREDGGGIKRWQLSQRIADVLDRYQFYRPDWIRQWADGEQCEEQPWQSVLWRELVGPAAQHRVALLDCLQTRLQTRLRAAETLQLPQRLCCFALSSLPPLYIEMLHSLALHTDVFLFQHSPTDQYWADLRSKRQLALMRLSQADEVDYYDTANDLLASWGRQGQAFQDLLLGDDSLQSAHWESYSDPGSTSLLQRLQQDIFRLQECAVQVQPDDSVSIAICHSPIRECQVLHDELLRTLQQDPSLRPEDILIMVPQISDYAPYIEAVFGSADGDNRPWIPWNLSDITVADEHPLVGIFLKLLDLPTSRFTFSEVMSCLDVPEIAARFRLDQQDCDLVARLLEQARVQWGLDGEHKQEFGLPPIEENTWHYALRRLMGSYALGESGDNGYWHDIAPLQGVEGGSAQAVGRFCELLERLRHWRLQLAEPRSASDWQASLNQLLDDVFLVLYDEEDKLQQIREAVSQLQQNAGEQTLSRELLASCLQQALGSQSVRGRFFSGGVTFCGMRPMRSLPFRIIGLLGMNDQAFPRREQAVEFDLMSRHWRPGDPRKGDEDRYLLLETLLCARQRLYLSYTGRSLKDNTACQPSVLLRQLLDFIDAQYHPADQPGQPMTQLLSRQYSMQPFSHRNYSAGQALSHDLYWCQVARSLAQDREQPEEDWPQARLPRLAVAAAPGDPEVIELHRLVNFLAHPVAFFYKQRLHIYLDEAQAAADEEYFEISGLQEWQLQSRMTGDWLRGSPTDRQVLQAEGLLPHGSYATLALDAVKQRGFAMQQQLADYQGITPQPLAISLSLRPAQEDRAELRLSGQLNHWSGRGLLHFTPSRLKGKNVLALWVEHLALCASGAMAEQESSVLFCRDDHLSFPPLAPSAARQQLQVYAELYEEGLQRPLPAAPRASFAYAQASDAETAMREALKCWRPSFGGPSDEEDPYLRLLTAGSSLCPLDQEEFAELAVKIYGPALQAGRAGGASS